jgi:hypothetical protein
MSNSWYSYSDWMKIGEMNVELRPSFVWSHAGSRPLSVLENGRYQSG